VTAASIFAARGKKLDALKQYEALANEASETGIESRVCGAWRLDRARTCPSGQRQDGQGHGDRAAACFKKGALLPEAGKFRAIAQVGFRRLQYQTGQYAQLLADYKKELDKLPEAAQAEVLLLAANSQRQLGHPKEAEALYRQITTKYPDREEAKDAAYQQLINVYNSDPSALSARWTNSSQQILQTNAPIKPSC
jgi:tetratricopeptide (TPR) repeat protein